MLPAPLSASDAARQHEKLCTLVFADHGALAVAVAARMAELIRERTAAARPVVLGLATGSTPIGVYRELIRLHREEGLSFRRVVTFNLDEYWPMAASSIHSYRRFMDENLFDHVDIDAKNVHIPLGNAARERVDEECRRY